MSQRHEVSISPDPTLMEDIGAASFTVAEAIVELVANSIDASNPEEPLEIDIFIDPSEIRVIDDAKGMEYDVLAQAIRLGIKMDKSDIGANPQKGMFGLGMKTACASLGRRWSITTRPREGDAEYYVEFDLKEWSDKAGDPDFEWSIEIEERDIDEDGVLGRRDHGTAIVVEELRHHNPLPGPVLDKLGRAYKGHIESGDIVEVNGEKARPPEYNFIEGSKVEIDTTCGDDEEYQITGWVALDKQTHNDDLFGLNLYRQDQLIEPWNKDFFTPHLMTSRIIGEINLDFVPPNFYKKGFERQSDEWNLAKEEMKEVLEPVVKASREASRGQDPQKFRKAARGLQKAMGQSGAVPEVPDEDIPEDEEQPDSSQSGETEEDDEEDVQVQPKSMVVKGKEIQLSYEMAEIPDEQLPWDYIYEDETDELQAILNTGSKILEESDDHEMLGTLALADCVAAFLTDEMNYDPADARRIRNQWLFRTLGG